MMGLFIRKYGDSMKVRPGYWFAQKRFGYGAVPVTLQGWVATFAYLALIGLALLLIPPVSGKFALGLVITAGYLILAYRKTDGGWRWRWGLDGD